MILYALSSIVHTLGTNSTLPSKLYTLYSLHNTLYFIIHYTLYSILNSLRSIIYYMSYALYAALINGSKSGPCQLWKVYYSLVCGSLRV